MSQKAVTNQEFASARQTLMLLAQQIQDRRVEKDYALRQVERINDLINRMEQMHGEQKSIGRLQALYDVSRSLGQSLEPRNVIHRAMDAVIQLTGAERGFLMLRDDDGNLRVEVVRQLDEQSLDSPEFAYSRSIANQVLDTGEAVITSNAEEDPRFKDSISVRNEGLRSIMAAPLRARGSIIGVAYVENRIIAGLFGEDDLATLEALGSQAAIAIDNALLFAQTDEQLKRRVEELQLLRRVDLQLSEKLDPDEATAYTLETACKLAGASLGYLGRVTEDSQHLDITHRYAQEGYPDEAPQHLDTAFPGTWDAVRAAETIINDSGPYGLRSTMIVPIQHERTPIGVMVLLRQDGAPFTNEQQDVVERAATRAAVTINNARLYSAVQAANRAKSEFVGIVAHDLKAPMTSIRGYADLILMDSHLLSEQHRHFLKSISDTVERMNVLVSDLADISRIESGEFLMTEHRVRVSSVIEATLSGLMPQIQERGHTFEQEVSDDLPDLWTDYYRLVQVLTNLLSNAIKYTPNGGTVTLSAQDEGERVSFLVRDTGIGLSEEALARLGEKFWRAEDSFTRSQPGTGLGFFITSQLVRQMGSEIAIESEVGKGSAFSFSVARASDDDEGEAL